MALRRIRALGLAGAALAFGPGAASAAVLYDQTDSGTLAGIKSDVYTDAPTADTQAADDFTVPAGQSWQISQVAVNGGIDGTPSTNVNLFIYNNASALPGAEVFRQTNVATTGSPNFVIPTNSPPLIPGTYWLSVQDAAATMTGSVWAWMERTVQSGNHAAVRNPGGFFTGGACTDWQPTTCLGAIGHDLIFRIDGTTAPYAPPPATEPSNQFSFGGVKLNKHMGTATLSVNVPGPGTLSVTGNNVKPRPLGRGASVSKTVTAAGTVKLLIEAKGKAKKKLEKTARAKVKVKVTYTPTGGSSNAQSEGVKLIKK
jgi:hypothetical protein